jgi:hypothetical protein
MDPEGQDIETALPAELAPVGRGMLIKKRPVPRDHPDATDGSEVIVLQERAKENIGFFVKRLGK